jgi:hypothetical protein
VNKQIRFHANNLYGFAYCAFDAVFAVGSEIVSLVIAITILASVTPVLLHFLALMILWFLGAPLWFIGALVFGL